MNERSLKIIAVTGLLVGGIFGMAGSFVSSPALRCLAWGLDGIGLIVATALLAVYYFRRGWDMIAAGFIVFALQERAWYFHHRDLIWMPVHSVLVQDAVYGRHRSF